MRQNVSFKVDAKEDDLKSISDLFQQFESGCKWLIDQIEPEESTDRKTLFKKHHKYMMYQLNIPFDFCKRICAKIQTSKQKDREINYKYMILNLDLLEIDIDNATVNINHGDQKIPVKLNMTKSEKSLIKSREIFNLLLTRETNHFIISFSLT